jgi:hypothetical protein
MAHHGWNLVRGASAMALLAVVGIVVGCRGHQFGHIVQDDQADLVGSHAAGAATFNPLVDEAVAKLLMRQANDIHAAAYAPGQAPRKRICFVGIDNRSAEELGDFKEQLYEQIDQQILQSQLFDSVSRRYVEAALRETRLRPDMLYLPQHMQTFTATLQQQGQPFDYLLYATLTTGTTQSNHSKQRDYVLTMELTDLRSGHSDKESAKIRKGYHKTAAGKWFKYNPFK